MDLNTLSALPFELITIVALGYFGYRIFSTGRDGHHKAYDVYFQSLFFSLPSLILLKIPDWSDNPWMIFGIMVLSLGVTILFALGVRFLFPIIQSIPRKLGVTIENYHPTTYTSFLAGGKSVIELIELILIDGTVLTSNISLVPDNVHHAKLDMDAAGNIAMYITNITTPAGNHTQMEKEEILHDYYGSGLTFIPSHQIARITLYRK